MTNSTGLAGIAAAVNVDLYVELAKGIGQRQRSANDHLEGLIAEVILYIAAIDGDNAGSGNKANAGNGFLTPTE